MRNVREMEGVREIKSQGEHVREEREVRRRERERGRSA